MTQKETLWINIYTEIIKKKSTIQAESAATKAVEAFERRFERYTIPKIDIEKAILSNSTLDFTPIEFPSQKVSISKFLKKFHQSTAENESVISWDIGADFLIDFNFDKNGMVIAITKVHNSKGFTQAGRLKRLLEEFDVNISCEEEEGKAIIGIVGFDVDFCFTDGEFQGLAT